MRRNPEFSVLMIVTFLLLCFAIIMAYSASAPVGLKTMGDDHYHFKRMIAFVIVGLIAMASTAVIRYETWTRHWYIFYASSIFALLLVSTPMGVQVGEARRSLDIGFTTIQPSEFARLAAVFFLASFCARKAEHLKNFKKGLLPALGAVSVLAGLILAGHDLGIPFTIGVTALLLLFIAGANLRHLLALSGAAFAGLVLMIVLEPYRVQRMLAFIDPWKDPKRYGWQIIQSMAALGSGGISGAGLGQGLQKNLYLPAPHTDFVFSIIGEETGLIGTLSINLLFAVLAVVGVRIALKARNREASFLSLGISFLISSTALINMAVAVDLLPTKGITLPFVSYGGSALLSNMIAMGILMNISRNSQEPAIMDPLLPQRYI
ncbi:MAG: putative lipid II flippase FtsW [Candidatus Abyssobacteria bacterium SURF_5]|uniref:Probable peptidoglycan glycosyltransferase FtsW n=1 Tax=Abyssobacteria bacterium (strain SURF_5) TaxID=2093360 RepID=A0A3A4NWC7_ABYX5|nr:MAG: putative lipid II flippase FtsW [Candidatus Abyssubacteria bacterium SURF_5]